MNHFLDECGRDIRAKQSWVKHRETDLTLDLTLHLALIVLFLLSRQNNFSPNCLKRRSLSDQEGNTLDGDLNNFKVISSENSKIGEIL